MTTKLFWLAPYQTTFQAQIVDRSVVNGQPGVVLDQTCFYATSGGQPHDTGTLSGVPVQTVEEIDGRIVHLLASPIEAQTVSGEIDWSRRFDHMQQHTGQHILSQAFVQVMQAETVSFHLGDEICTIDIDTPGVSIEQVATVEDLANTVIHKDRSVATATYNDEEVADLGLRKRPQVSGSIRVVSIGDFDRCACGGTHVARTGEIGMIHVSRCVHYKGMTRVEFLCGRRALDDYRRCDLIVHGAAQSLSVHPNDLSERVQALVDQGKVSRQTIQALRKRLLAFELTSLTTSVQEVGEYKVVARVLESMDAGNMRYLAQQIVSQPDMVALLAVTEPSVQFCFGRSANLDVNMGQLLREAAKPFGGRGGGKPHMAQGGGVSATDLNGFIARGLELLGQAP